MRQGLEWSTTLGPEAHSPHLDFTHTHLNPGSHHRYLAGLKLWLSSGSYHTHDGSVMENSWGKADSLIHNPQSLRPIMKAAREKHLEKKHIY